MRNGSFSPPRLRGSERNRSQFGHPGTGVAEGRLVGELTDQNGDAVFPDGQWVPKQEALRIARNLGVELFEY